MVASQESRWSDWMCVLLNCIFCCNLTVSCSCTIKLPPNHLVYFLHNSVLCHLFIRICCTYVNTKFISGISFIVCVLFCVIYVGGDLYLLPHMFVLDQPHHISCMELAPKQHQEQSAVMCAPRTEIWMVLFSIVMESATPNSAKS